MGQVTTYKPGPVAVGLTLFQPSEVRLVWSRDSRLPPLYDDVLVIFDLLETRWSMV